VALRHGARDARRHKGRTALVATMVALPVLVGTFATTSLWSVQGAPERRIETELGPRLQAELVYLQPGAQQSPDALTGGTDGELRSVPFADAEAAVTDAMPAGDSLVATLRQPVVAHGPELQRSGTALQSDLADPDVAAAFTLTEGRLPDTGEVALSAEVADDLGVGLGDTVRVEPDRATPDALTDGLGAAKVSGLLGGDQPGGAGVLYPTDGPLRPPAAVGEAEVSPNGVTVGWFVSGDVPVTWDDVLRLNEAGALVTSRAVLLDPPPDSAVPLFEGAPQTDTAELLRSWGPIAAVVAVALLEAVLLVGPAFAVGARRSARSLALVAAHGGTERSLRAIVLGTGVVIGVGASTLGVLLGVVGAGMLLVVLDGSLRGLRFLAVPWLPVLGILVVGVLLTAAAASLPARGASRADVVAVLAGRRGETAHRRWPAAAGAVAAAAGFAGAVVAGLAGQPLLLAAGVVVGELGLVLACGGIVALLGRAAGQLPLSWRFALRDAARHRARTSPAIAAVLVACAGAGGGLVYSASQALHDYRSQSVTAAPGTLLIAPADGGAPDAPTTLDETQVDEVRALVADVAPVAEDLRTVTVLRAPAEGAVITSVLTEPADVVGASYSSGHGAIVGPVVDDGSLVDVLGIPDAGAARAGLRAGRAVAAPTDLWADGTVHLTVSRWDREQVEAVGRERQLELPAVAVGDPAGPATLALPLVPPELAAAADVPTAVGGLLASPTAPLSQAEVDTLQAALDDRFGTDGWGGCHVCAGVAEPPARDDGWLAALLIVGAAGLLALAAAWIATALAATESRPDLATLAAVGAAPSTRKRVVAAQAGTIAVVGAVIGTVSGIGLGAAFVLYERHRYDPVDLTWSVVVPWPWLAATVVALPALAVAAAWLVTRSRLVLARRLVD
jgi:putative ABC transport system permease protein